jgi:DNA (cytosine-5)-methyltransferase 1
MSKKIISTAEKTSPGVKLKAIDFFCGGGGMTFGLRQAGINVIAGIDFDDDCRGTYEANNPGSIFIHCDINDLECGYLEKVLDINKNDDNMIFVGCSPCQYYSIIRSDKTRASNGKDLLLQFKRFVDYFNPGYILVENVPGITSNKDSVFPKFIQFLDNKGYKKRDYGIVNMKDYGIPQNRKRFSLVATRIDKSISLPPKDMQVKTVRDVLGESHGFTKVEAGYNDPTEFFHTVARLSELNLKRVQKTPKDGGTRLAWKDDPKLQLKCYIDKDDCFRDVYGRLKWGKPSSTITTNFYKTSNGRFSHPEENRALSIREGATLQSFPMSYIFKTSSMTQAAKMIGNAVPPEYARRLGLVITEHRV